MDLRAKRRWKQGSPAARSVARGAVTRARGGVPAGLHGLSLAVLAFLGASSCGGGGGGGGSAASSSNEMRVVSCSLGCSGSIVAPLQFQCGVTEVYTNQEFRITFNADIDFNSVTRNSFQLTQIFDPSGNSVGGSPAPGIFRADVTDPRVLIFNPVITFDSSGTPTFGLTAGATYELRVPGTDIDPVGPYVRSMSGEENSTRVLCNLIASRGVFDVNSGSPRVKSVLVDKLDPTQPTGLREVDARNETDVYRDTQVRITFDDVMDPDTLLNIVTQSSTTIGIRVDPDGDLSDPSDQIVVPGSYTLSIDQIPQTSANPNDPLVGASTTVLFDPSNGFPSAGQDSPARKIVIALSNSIKDAAGNPLVQAGNIAFTVERIPFPTIQFGETFDNQNFEDAAHGGSVWGGGIVLKGPGGGSGRLGDLVIPVGEVITMNTDSEDFTRGLLAEPTVFNPQNVIDPGVGPIQVDGGLFEFARMIVEPGAVLRLEGSNPARFYVRGECIIQGRLDASGLDSVIHDPSLDAGSTAKEPGPAGGRGGDGGARPDGEAFVSLDPDNDNPLDLGPDDPTNPADYVFINGQNGVGIPYPSSINELMRVGSGQGGLAWPQPGVDPVYPLIRFPIDVTDSVVSFPYSPFSLCSINAPGAAGSGGAHALDGRQGGTGFIPAVMDPPRVPESPAGDNAGLMIDPTVMSLDPAGGLLRGGAGGGGGAGHILRTTVNGTLLFDCTLATPLGATLLVQAFKSYSGAAGGSGGGAIQIQTGRRLILNGVVDVSGGDGGSASGEEFAVPGGGGAGGSLLLQARQLQIQPVPERINLRGGLGGVGAISSFGGEGAPGFLRLESFAPIPEIRDPDGNPVEEAKVAPRESTLRLKYGPSVDIFDLISAGLWDPPTFAPDSQSGVQSCWFSERDFPSPTNPTARLTNFFELRFEEDDPGAGTLGWDMLIKLTDFPDAQSYRGSNDLPDPRSLEEIFGAELGAAPVVVRFQGAHTLGRLPAPCNVPLAGSGSQLVPGSLTGWVKHPAELSDFFGDPSKTPNIFRFVVLWDSSHPEFDRIEHIEEIFLTMTPD